MSVVQSETLYSLYWNLCINPSSVSVDWSATSGAQPWSIIDICQFPHSSLSIFYHLYSSQYLSNSFSALSPSHRSPSMVTLSLSFVFFLFGNLLIPDYSKVYPQASSTPCKSFSFLHHFLFFLGLQVFKILSSYFFSSDYHHFLPVLHHQRPCTKVCSPFRRQTLKGIIFVNEKFWTQIRSTEWGCY